ncbi:6-phosphogluconolactonase [Plantibacter sp. Mn2098]|uniref:6-phosphogluconolactonase n=1 Tax=Plantibacter sp. Mn2098 TaxID=3395266 RepID=UPI003BC4B030
MANERRVLVYPDRDQLTSAVAKRFLSRTRELLEGQDVVHVVLTGGTVGIGSLAAVAASKDLAKVDFSRVHFWWGDERWVARDSADRNEVQAREALLDALDVPAANIHAFAASDEGVELDDAAVQYAEELRSHAPEGQDLPRFDITFLGVGPDGHIASLFPERREITVTDATVVSVRNSPKPPPERLSLTRGAINSSVRVWLVMSGDDKASALGLTLAGASFNEVPAAGAKGRKRTVFFVDQAAAAEVPDSLILPEY